MSCLDLAQLLDSYPGLLESYIRDGLAIFINQEKNLVEILRSIDKILEKYPSPSPIKIYEMLEAFDAFTLIEQASQ